MGALTAARLAAWRELRARWPLLLAGPALWAFGAAVPDYYRAGWDAFLLVLLLPVLCGLLAVRGGAAADNWWRGLGGPGWARLAGTAAVQLPPLVFTAGMAQLRLVLAGSSIMGGELSDYVIHFVLVAVYAVGLASRSLCAGLPTLAGFLGASLALAAGLVASSWLRLLPYELGLALRLGLLALGGLALAAVWEGRLGPWGAAVRRHGRWAGPLALLVFALLCVGGEAALRIPHRGSIYSGDIILAEDGSRVLRITSRGRAWLWQDGRDRLLADRFVCVGYLGPWGSLALKLTRGGRDGPFALLLRDARGRSQECSFPTTSEPRWRPDGLALSVRGWNGRTYLLDLDQGCQLQTSDIRGIRWLGPRQLVTKTDGLYLDGKYLEDVPWPSRVRAVSSTHLVTQRYQERAPPRRGYQNLEKTLFAIREDGVERVTELEDWYVTATPERICTHARSSKIRPWRCWDQDGETVHHPPEGYYWRSAPDLAWRPDPQGVQFTDTVGRYWIRPDEYIDFTRLDPDRLRVLAEDAVIDLHADGSRTEHRLRSW